VPGTCDTQCNRSGVSTTTVKSKLRT